MPTFQNIIPSLWFPKEAHLAAEYYVSIFPNSKIISSNGFITEFELMEQTFIAFIGAQLPFNDAISFTISCKDQEEVDYFWEKLSADGGQEVQSGWLRDKYGLAWQVIPEVLPQLINHPDPEKAQQVIAAMMQMKKIIIADLKAAFEA